LGGSSCDTVLEHQVVIVEVLLIQGDYWLRTISNHLDKVGKSDKTNFSVGILLVHLIDLTKNSLFDAFNSHALHTSGNIDAVYNRYILCDSGCLGLLDFLSLSGRNGLIFLRCGFENIANSFLLRLFLRLKTNIVLDVTELTFPLLFTTVSIFHYTVQI